MSQCCHIFMRFFAIGFHPRAPPPPLPSPFIEPGNLKQAVEYVARRVETMRRRSISWEGISTPLLGPWRGPPVSVFASLLPHVSWTQARKPLQPLEELNGGGVV